MSVKSEKVASSVSHINAINTWADNFLYEVSKEWLEFMNEIQENNEDAVDINVSLINEVKRKIEFISEKIEEEKLQKETLALDVKLLEKEYAAAAIPSLLVKQEFQYYEVLEAIENLRREIANETDLVKKKTKTRELAKLEKRMTLLDKKHEEYLDRKSKREELKKKITQAEDKQKKYLEYLKTSKYNLTEKSVQERVLRTYESVRDYNQKVLFDDIVKFRDEFYRKLNDKNASDQLSKKIVSVMKSTTNGQLYSGEFTESEILSLFYFFTEEMDKYNFKGFNFIKNALLDYQQDISNQEMIKLEFNAIPFQKFLTGIINSISMQINGAMHHGFERFKATRDGYSSIDQKINDGNSDDKDLTLGDRISPDDSLPEQKKIYNDNVIDVSAQDLYGGIKDFIISNKNKIATQIMTLLKNKLPKTSIFNNPNQRVKMLVVNAVEKTMESIGEEVVRGNYVSPRIKNIVVDSFGGIENSLYIGTVVNIVKNVLEYESLKYMIENIEKSVNENDGRLSEKTQRLQSMLETIRKNTLRDIRNQPKIASKF